MNFYMHIPLLLFDLIFKKFINYDYIIFQDCDCNHKYIWNGINNKSKSNM